jgi:hypothetical protein
MNYSLVACRKSLMLLAGCLMVIATVGEGIGNAQEINPNPVEELKEASSSIRPFVRQEILEAAGDFHITLQPNNFTALSRDDVFAVGANLAGVEQLGLENLRNGAVVDMIFFFPQAAQPFLPTGFYLVKAFGGPDIDRFSVLDRSPQRAELINEDGVTVAALPLVISMNRGIDSATPIQSVKAGVDNVQFDLHWNVHANQSVNLSFAIPLKATVSH